MPSVDWDALGGGMLGDLLEGDTVDLDFGERYEVGELLGSGGQGSVYAAFDTALDRRVAIKRLHDPSRDQSSLLAEARLLSKMAHPAIPQIYDRGICPDGGVFVVMQLVCGRSLGSHLKAVDPDLGARLRLFRSIVAAVGHAHHRGVLHRDLKPANLMVTAAAEAYIIDWGLAATGDPRAICGSPHFAAPEQLEGQVADRRADVYALGVLLYYMLSDGELPYGRHVRDFHEFKRLRAGLQRVSLAQRCPGLPRALERICDTAMAAQAGARYRTTEELLADLDAFAAGRPLARDPRTRRTGPWFAALAAAACLVLGVLLGRVFLSADAGAVPPAAPQAAPVFTPQPEGVDAFGADGLDLEGGAAPADGARSGQARALGDAVPAAPAAAGDDALEETAVAPSEVTAAPDTPTAAASAATPAVATDGGDEPVADGPEPAEPAGASAVDGDLAAAIRALSGSPAPAPSPLLPSFEEVERTLEEEGDGGMESGRPGGNE